MPVSSYEKDKQQREARQEAQLRREQRSARQAEIDELERLSSLPDERPEEVWGPSEPEGQPERERRRESAYDRIRRMQELKKKWGEREGKKAGKKFGEEGAEKGGAAAARQLGGAAARGIGQAGVQGAGELGATGIGGAGVGGTAVAGEGVAGVGGAAVGGGGVAAAGAAPEVIGAVAATEATPVGWVITIALVVILVVILIVGVVLGSFFMLCSGEAGGTASKVTVATAKFFNIGGLGDLCKALSPLSNGSGQGMGGGNFADQDSPQLRAFMTCVQSTVPSGVNLAPVSPTTDSHIAAGTCNPLDSSEIFNSGSRCQHAQYSCHYGGQSTACQTAGSFAVDYASPGSCRAIRTAAYACASSLGLSAMPFVNYEGNHVHVSVGPSYGCGCDVAGGGVSCP